MCVRKGIIRLFYLRCYANQLKKNKQNRTYFDQTINNHSDIIKGFHSLISQLNSYPKKMDILRKPQIISHIEKSLDFSIYETKWIPCSAKFVVLGCKANGYGVLKVFELNSGNLDLVGEREQKQSFKCGSFGASSLRRSDIAVGDFDGKLQIL